MKRSAVLLFLCILFLTVPVSAASDIRVDGNIHVFSEYKEVGTVIAPINRNANCSVSYAYMHYAVDISDYQLYLAIEYVCDDYVPEGGKSGVEITVNDVLCTTFYTDGTFGEIDPYFYVAESAFRCFDGPPPEINCELRIGVKYGFFDKTVVGVRILDCSGEPSNYYEAVVYTPPETTASESTTQEPSGTTTLRETETETKKQTAAVSETTVSTDVRHTGTTAPRLTLATRNGLRTTTNAEKVSGEKAEKSGKEKVTRKDGKSKNTEPLPAEKSEIICTTAVEESTSAEPITESVSEPENLIRYKRFSKVKTIGIAAAASLLTAAVLTSVFLVLTGRKKEGAEPDE